MKSTPELDCILMEIIERLEPLGYAFGTVEKRQLRSKEFQSEVIRLARSAYKIDPNCDLTDLVTSFSTKQMELLFSRKGE
jgi:hypothetical protein